MPRQPEGRLVKKIREYLISQGARPFKIQGSDEVFQEAGIPDLLVCYKGFFLAIEVKQPGEQPTAKQRAVMRSITRAGGMCIVADSLIPVERALSKLDKMR